MKRICSFFFALCLGICAQAQSVFEIPSGKAVMTVDAETGGKVISLKLDGKELLAQHKKPQQGNGAPFGGMRFENKNDYGSTFWPSPQSEWNWPPIATYDSKPYTAVKEGEALILTSGTDEKYPYVFAKKYQPLGDGRYSITYTITNMGESTVSVAPWEITRVPSGGEISFEAPAIRPENEVEYLQTDGIIRIPFVEAKKNRKIFADATGWLTFQNDELRFTKRFPDITHEQAAPGEDEVEIYWNFGTTYIEIENQGAYVSIAPKESHSWTVDWEITLP